MLLGIRGGMYSEQKSRRRAAPGRIQSTEMKVKHRGEGIESLQRSVVCHIGIDVE
jgi:hypothetical protein